MFNPSLEISQQIQRMAGDISQLEHSHNEQVDDRWTNPPPVLRITFLISPPATNILRNEPILWSKQSWWKKKTN